MKLPGKLIGSQNENSGTNHTESFLYSLIKSTTHTLKVSINSL
jgi:hypothetical protein